MASKQVRMRFSWPLDELTSEMATHYGYPDKTAFIKSLIRYAATVDKREPHQATIEQSKLSPAAQDKLDAELLRKWKAGETKHRQLIVAAVEEACGKFDRLPAGLRDALVAAIRREVTNQMELPLGR